MNIFRIFAAMPLVALVACGGDDTRPPSTGSGGTGGTASTTSGAFGGGGSGGTTTSSTSECAPELADCGGSCVDLARDPFNCGDCGNECAAGDKCAGSSCMSCDTVNECAVTGWAGGDAWTAWPVVGSHALQALSVEVRADTTGYLYVLKNGAWKPGAPIAGAPLKPTSDPAWRRADLSFDLVPGQAIWIAVDVPVRTCDVGTASVYAAADPVTGEWAMTDILRPIAFRLHGFCGASDPYHAPDCTSGACGPRCGDCDGNPDNGCESSLELANNCGACGVVCSAPWHCGPACDGVGPFDCHASFDDCP